MHPIGHPEMGNEFLNPFEFGGALHPARPSNNDKLRRRIRKLR
jgi:hypothetical protein